jgi:hypothetical protein
MAPARSRIACWPFVKESGLLSKNKDCTNPDPHHHHMASASTAAALSLSMISRDVPLGANRPNHEEKDSAGSPISAKVGISGAAARRVSLVIA